MGFNSGFKGLSMKTTLLTPLGKKVNVKVLPVQGMQAYGEWGCWGASPLILNLGTGCRLVVNITTRLLYPPLKNTGTQWIRGWVGSRAVLDVLEKREISCPLRDTNPEPTNPSLPRLPLTPLDPCMQVYTRIRGCWTVAVAMRTHCSCAYDYLLLRHARDAAE